MKQYLKISLACTVLIFLLSGCAAGPTGSASRTVALTEKDAGREIALRVGDRLEVTLPGNPTTGYTWEAQPPVDGIILKQEGEAEFRADSNRVGSGGQVALAFQAASAGASDLTLVYHRSWEKEVPPEGTFTVKVNVSQ